MTDTYDQGQDDEPEKARWNVSEWHGRTIIDSYGEKIGKLQDVYVDVETDEPQFATVKEGFIDRHLTFVPLGGVQIGPDDLQVQATKEAIRTAPDIEMHGEELSHALSPLRDELHAKRNGKRTPSRSSMNAEGRDDVACHPAVGIHLQNSLPAGIPDMPG